MLVIAKQQQKKLLILTCRIEVTIGIILKLSVLAEGTRVGVPLKEVKLSEVVLDLTKPLAFDTETCGLYGRIRLGQFYQEGWDAVLLVNNPDPLELAMVLKNVKVVMHNASYDISTIQDQTDMTYIPNDYEDTFLLARLKFYNKEKFSADAVMEYVLGYDPYVKAGFDKKMMQKSDWNVLALTESQKIYAAIDVYYLLDVYDAVKDQADTTSYKLDMLTLGYCLDFQRNGMPVLNDEVQKQYA